MTTSLSNKSVKWIDKEDHSEAKLPMSAKVDIWLQYPDEYPEQYMLFLYASFEDEQGPEVHVQLEYGYFDSENLQDAKIKAIMWVRAYFETLYYDAQGIIF